MARIEDVLWTMGFVTKETEPLAAEIYAEVGTTVLTFLGVYIQGLILKHKDKLPPDELKSLVISSAITSSFVALALAGQAHHLDCVGLAEVFDDVLEFSEEQEAKLIESIDQALQRKKGMN